MPDRALMWKKARMPKGEGQQIDKNLAEINKKIVRPFFLCLFHF